MTKPVQFLAAISFLIFCCNCGEDIGENGKINITLNAGGGLTAENTDPNTTKVSWACIVLSENETACIYYYNGEAQVDGSVTNEAAESGPGVNGFTFVASGTTISGLEGGERNYFIYNANFDNITGEPVSDVFEITGTLDLYSNEGKEGEDGEDINWTVGFGTSGEATSDIVD